MVAILNKQEALFGIIILLSVIFNTATAYKTSLSSRRTTPLLPKTSQEIFSKTLFACSGRSGGLVLRSSASILFLHLPLQNQDLNLQIGLHILLPQLKLSSTCSVRNFRSAGTNPGTLSVVLQVYYTPRRGYFNTLIIFHK